MPKEKVEISNQRKTTKPSNGPVQKVQKPKISSRSKIDEIKKPATTRESSVDRTTTDRNNLRKSTSYDAKISKKPETISTRNGKTITSLNKTKSSIDTTAASTSVRKPLKPTRSTPTITNVTSSRPQVTPTKGTKTSSRDVTSKRVTKEQYFPKKYPFSSYLHETPSNETQGDKIDSKIKKSDAKPEPPKITRERTKTRTLSPSEIKVIKNIVDVQKPERPRTATIRKAEEPKIVENNDEANDYEDDFESYESDFEEYSSSSVLSIETDGHVSETSSSDVDSERVTEFNQKRTNSAGTDDERKLDSGNYELHDVKHKQILDNIKEAIEKENSNLNTSINKTETINSLASLSDEGFEDGSKYLLVNNGFVNFMDAKKKQQKKKISLKNRKRGDDLMNMIRLNSVYFSLFDMEAISYEDFMQSYGKAGTMQISSQTGDDDLDEDIQTDKIEMVDKFTQYPIRFSKQDDFYFVETLNHKEQINAKGETRKLNKFMEKAGKLMLHILEQKETKTQIQFRQNYSEIPFSDGYLAINFERTQFLRNRNVVYMTYNRTGQLLTVHEGGIEVFMNENEQLLARPTICLWDIFELSYPQYILVSSGDVMRACFDDIHGNFVFGGVCDGSICLWDLRETNSVHRDVYDEQSDDNHLMRTPTYTTIPNINMEACCEKIIAVKSFHMQTHKTELNNSQNGIQICTCTETGNIIIWSLIQRQVSPELLSEDQGLTIWGSVVLVQGQVIQLQKLNPNLKELQCFDLEIHENDTNHLFVASNHGVLHCLVSGMKPKPKLYLTENSVTNCVEMAPFSPTYFLSGCCDGNIILHSRLYEKPLMVLRTLNDCKIEMIQWLNSRPCVLFVKDDKNNIHIWDLMASDMFPIYTIPFNENITDIKISPILKQNEPVYMAIANKEYGIRLHKMNEEFCRLTPEQYKTELNTFLNYANRL